VRSACIPIIIALAFASFVVLAQTVAAEDGACVQDTAACAGALRHAAQSDPAQQLAVRYTPIVYLKDQSEPCDSKGEPYAPVSVDAVLANDAVTLRTAPGETGVERPGASDLYAKGEDYFLDLPGDPSRPGCTYETDFRALAPTLANVTYAHVVTEPGKRGVALQYWFYYYFNDWNNNHESDWEMIQIIFDADTVEEALGVTPHHVGYSQHSGGEYAEWDGDKLRREGDRPLVYVAAGSHSNQYGQHNYLGRAEEGAGFGCDDATPPATRVDLEPVLVPDSVTGPDDPFAWVTYTGRWGERLKGEFNGPTGPNTKSQWTKPITWDETKLRDSNVQVPTGRTAGISPTNAFCSTVAWVSRYLLALVENAPWLLPAVGLAFAGSIFITVRNTRFDIVGQPLRRSRRMGQIFRTALSMYRANFWLMVGVALVYLPAGILASLLQAMLFRFDPIDAILDLIAVPRVVDAALSLLAGTIVFGFAYIAVTAAVTAAVAEIEAGRPASPLSAYAGVWERFGDLFRARLRSLAIIIGLAITVVGIPWAIKRSVDWVFIEQAVLLDGEDRSSALQASAGAVRGDWLRVAAINLLLLAVGALTPLLVVTPLLLLTTAVPLDAINTISSAIYIFLAPFVALSLVLLYFDVRTRQ